MYNPYQQQGFYANQNLQNFNGFLQQPQLQPQATGFVAGSQVTPGAGLSSNPTGYFTTQQVQQQQPGGNFAQGNFQYGVSAVPNLGLTAQATGFQSLMNNFQPQATGFQTSAQGFAPQPTGFSSAASTMKQNLTVKIPNIRLSFITASDQQKFEDLFRTALPPGEQAISGDSARDILLRSGLQPVTLALIWSLSDTNKTGFLLFPEFALALHLCNLSLKGEPLPGVLPEKWLNEVKSFVDAINFSVPEDPNKILKDTPFASFGNSQPEQKQNEWFGPPQTSFQPQATGAQSTFGGLQAQRTGTYGQNSFASPQPSFGATPLTSQRTGGGTLIPLQPQQTAGLIPAQKTGPLTQQLTGYGTQQASLNPQSTGFQLRQPSVSAPGMGSLQPQNTGFQQRQAPPSAQTAGPLQAQTTGYQLQPLQAQGTGYQPQTTGFQPQVTGFQPQVTGFQPQATGFQPQATGLQPQATGLLQAQPTGKPGQWGFVSMPTGGIPGLNAMEQHFLPSSQMSSNNLQNVMGGSLKSNVTWAITKQEKQIYDGIFNAWDSSRRGYIDGEIAIGIFGKSGLSRPDLESIWTLADGSNRGKLNKDEFAVAMHLVYRRLNGYDIPLRLPPELVPPSSKLIQDSFDSLKQSIKGGKPLSRSSTSNLGKTDGSRYKNDDSSVGYVSNSRHRAKSLESQSNQSSVKSSKNADLSIDDLKKLIREKKILLDAMDAEDQDKSYSNKQASSQSAAEIESLKRKIKGVQDRLDTFGSGNTSLEGKKALLAKLDHLTRDVVPSLISKLNDINNKIADSKIELAKAKLKKQNPSWDPSNSEAGIVGTGPNGEVTDADRRKFKSKQLLNQRMAALTGKSLGSGNSQLDQELNQTVETTNREKQEHSAMIKDIETSIKDLEDGCVANLQVTNHEEIGASKWEKGEGVGQAVLSFIRELSSTSEALKQQRAAQVSQPAYLNSQAAPEQPSLQVSGSSTGSTGGYKTPEERAAYIKAQAEKRMNERLAKLGITRRKSEAPPPQPVESPVQQKPQPQPEPVVSKPVVSKPVVNKEPEAAVTASRQVPAPTNQQDDNDEDDDDAEYKALVKQKAEMEARDKERRAKRKQEKEARLAKLKKEMEDLKKKEAEGSSSDEEEPVTAPTYGPGGVSTSLTNSQPQATISDKNGSPSNEVTKAQPTPQQPSQPAHEDSKSHDNNPFAKLQNGTTPSSSTSSIPHTNTNPFFKSTPTGTPLDSKKAEAQRASQRGFGGGDDWSDDEEQNDSEDDEASRAGAAHLASLLFGGMSQPPPRSDSNLSTPTVEKEAANPPPVPEQAVPPSAEPAPRAVAVPVAAPPAPPVPEATAPPAPPAPPVAPPIPQVALPSLPTAPPPVGSDPGDSDTDSSDFDFSTPPMQKGPSPEVPPIPSSIPPAPPIPTEAPPVPSGVPPPPPPPLPTGAQSAPPPPPGPPPPPLDFSAAPAPTGAPDITALLGQITGGKSLKKVDSSQQRIADSAPKGRVL